MGAHFAYETHLADSPNVAMNTVHSLLHIAHSRKAIDYYDGMTADEFYQQNKEFITTFQRIYMARRNYDVSLGCMREGVKLFIERMEHLHRH